jgi:hypothetical protein
LGAEEKDWSFVIGMVGEPGLVDGAEGYREYKTNGI